MSSHFSPQPNKINFHLSNFPFLQPTHIERKLNIFYPLTFPFSQPNGSLV